MFKQKPFPFSMLVLVILIVVHLTGSIYSLYWFYSWFDILVHILSGLWVALIVIWLALICGQLNSLKKYNVRSLLIALVSAGLFGVAWELIESLTRITSTSLSGYYLDTTFDIVSDLVGGIFAYLYFIKKKKCNQPDSDILHPFYNQTGIINK